MLELLIWAGAILTILGLLGLVWCIVIVWKARRAGPPEAEMKARLQKVVALNLGALAVSGFGLMLVLTGIILT